jgi:metallophosphoesterase superfamily enzyme
MPPSDRSPAQPVRREILPGVWADGRRALWLPDLSLLVVADLHWGYAASHRARGNLLPDWGDATLGEQLDGLLADYRPAEMVWLGDVVHAAEGGVAAERYLARSPVPVRLVAGNHDRRWAKTGEPSLVRGRYFFHHGDRAPAVPAGHVEVLGHHHPALAWYDGAGGNLKLPAFVVTPERVVLPAFSPWAAGADCAPLLTTNATVWAVAPQRIFAVVPPSHRQAV